MTEAQQSIVQRLAQLGFRVAYQTSALEILVHPDCPGSEARIGTLYVVLERDGAEVYRALLDRFDAEEAMRRLGCTGSYVTRER